MVRSISRIMRRRLRFLLVFELVMMKHIQLLIIGTLILVIWGPLQLSTMELLGMSTTWVYFVMAAPLLLPLVLPQKSSGSWLVLLSWIVCLVLPIAVEYFQCVAIPLPSGLQLSETTLKSHGVKFIIQHQGKTRVLVAPRAQEKFIHNLLVNGN